MAVQSTVSSRYSRCLSAVRRRSAEVYIDLVKRRSRAGVEDRWHRSPKPGEQVPYPADHTGPGTWCTDPKHGEPGTLVTSARHGQGLRWLARWVDHDGNERSKAFARKAEAQGHITDMTTALTTGSYADPKRGPPPSPRSPNHGSTPRADCKPKTRAGYRSLLDAWCSPGGVRHRSETSPTPTFRHGSTSSPPTPGTPAEGVKSTG